MIQNTFVVFKDTRTDTVYEFDPTRYLNPGETASSLVIQQAPYPATTPALTATVSSMLITLSGGVDGVSYGCPLLLTTSTGRVVVVQLAVTVEEASLFPTVSQDPTSFADLVESVQAGCAARAVATFIFDPTTNPTGGFVTWSLLDSTGQVYNQGTAYEYRVNSTGVSNIVRASCIVSIPSNVVPSTFDTKYQIQYQLWLSGTVAQTVAENVTVIGLNTTPLGTTDMVEFIGNTAPLQLVTDKLYSNVSCSIQSDNATIGFPLPVYDFERVDSGYLWTAPVNTSALAPVLDPYIAVWTYFNTNQAAVSETAKLFVANSSMLDAAQDVAARVNKARTTLYGSPDLLFPPEVIFVWLRRGRDYFNSYAGQFTNMTMVNAKGPIREMWLQCAEMFALESQELAEAEKAFNYSGANIQLDVDRTQAYSAAANEIKSRIDSDLRLVKTNLIIKGNISGDGSADPTKLQRGATGTVGINISPATLWGRFPTSGPSVGGRFY